MFGSFSGVEGGEPTPDGNSQRLNLQPAMDGRKTLQLRESCVEQVPRPFPVGTRMVVKRRSHLNQTLQKLLVGFRGFQPDLFPMFMSFVEVSRIERFQSLLVQVGSCMQIHARFWMAGHLDVECCILSDAVRFRAPRCWYTTVPNPQNSAFEFLGW
jgi:hypothetical protein